MKSAIEMVNDVYSQVNIPFIKGLIDGNIIRYRRPKGSTKTDIVVNSIGLNNQMLQTGVVNVNVHTPSLSNVKFNGIADEQQPDLTKLNSVASIVQNVLDANYPGGDFHTDCEPGQPIQDNDGTWYINIRVNYYSVLTNFKNI